MEVGLCGKIIPYLESRGYDIPKYKNKNNIMVVKHGTKIKVQINDLMENSTALVRVYCDNCYAIKKITYEKYIHRHSNGYLCRSCLAKQISLSWFKWSYNNQKKYIENNGCILLTSENEFNQDIGKVKKITHIKLLIICSCGDNSFRRDFHHFHHRKQTFCKKCEINNRSGENSPRWNNSLTLEDREIGRKTPEDFQWRKKVFEKDIYICQRCEDDTGGNLNAHHKDGYNWCIERRTDVTNGVTLCEDCHKEFHSIYGYGDNTEKQFIDWMQTK